MMWGDTVMWRSRGRTQGLALVSGQCASHLRLGLAIKQWCFREWNPANQMVHHQVMVCVRVGGVEGLDVYTFRHYVHIHMSYHLERHYSQWPLSCQWLMCLSLLTGRNQLKSLVCVYMCVWPGGRSSCLSLCLLRQACNHRYCQCLCKGWVLGGAWYMYEQLQALCAHMSYHLELDYSQWPVSSE